VSDRYENDTGSLLGWGLTVRSAQCDPNVNAPETEIQAAPPMLVGSRSASFQFGSPRPNSQFQCRLDGGDFMQCASPQQFSDLPEGTHTFEVRAFDQYGNVDGSPAIYTWVVDVTAPEPRIASAGGSAPSVSGSAGTASGDNDTVTVDLYSGATATGSPSQSVVVPLDGAGSWGAQFDRVSGGAYTVIARQGDAAGNRGSSPPAQFRVGGSGAAGEPAFAIVSTEESLRDAAAGRLTALSACDATCSRTTSLAVSSRIAGRLGVTARGKRSVRLGGSRAGAGAGAVKVGMSRKVRRALGRSRASLGARLSAAAGSASLTRAITLRPKLSPAGVARRGLGLAGVCSSQCTIEARLMVSASTARRLGLRASGASVAIGSGSVHAAGSAAQSLRVRVARSMRRALSRARGADLTLEVKVSGQGSAPRRAVRRVTLGRG